MAFCTRCGATLAPHARFCAACGQAVDASADASVATATTAGLSRNEALGLYVGNNAGYYLDRWRIADERGSKLSWNWAALLLGLLWMTYRKMYHYAWIFIGLVLLESLLELAFDFSGALSILINLAVATVFGAQGNAWYRRSVEERVDAIVAAHPPQRARLELAAQGGTSVPAAILFAMIFLVTVLVAIYLSQIAMGRSG